MENSKQTENQTENKEVRDLRDAPDTATKKGIKEWLVSKGAAGIISTNAVAQIIGCSRRVIKNAENDGAFKILDKCTYDLDSVVEWLWKHPRYIAQNKKYYEVTESTYKVVRAIVLQNARPLLKLWNNDTDDLVAEICYRIGRKTIGATKVSDRTLAINIINDLWREKQTQQMLNTVSLDALREKGYAK
jgi:hypothetical protein